MRGVALLIATFVAIGCSGATPSVSEDARVEDAGDSGALDARGAFDDASEDSGATPDTAVAADASGDSPDAPELRAATITSVITMKDGLHVMWTPNETGLDAVELWRRRNANPYELVHTLGGTTDNLHDGPLTSPAFYCYRVRNVRSGVTSPMSAEECGAL